MWRAWEELTTCRGYTMAGPGPIPWSAIHDWSRHKGLSADDLDDLAQWIWALDAELMKRD